MSYSMSPDFEDEDVRPSTAGSDSSSSTLSPPPASPTTENIANGVRANAIAALVDEEDDIRDGDLESNDVSVADLDLAGQDDDLYDASVNGDAEAEDDNYGASENGDNDDVYDALINDDAEKEIFYAAVSGDQPFIEDDETPVNSEQAAVQDDSASTSRVNEIREDEIEEDAYLPISAYVPGERKYFDEDGESGENREEQTDMEEPVLIQAADDATEAADSEIETPTDSADIPELSNISLTKKTRKTGRYPFKKLTSLEEFEKYLEDPESMSYTKLYSRLGYVADSMVEIQKEYMQLEEELKAYEEEKKSRAKEEEEAIRPDKDERQKREDARLKELNNRYHKQIKGPLLEWKDFLEAYEKNNPNEEKGTVDLLRSLRDPKVLAAVNKRLLRAKQPTGTPIKVTNAPLPPPKDLEKSPWRAMTQFDDQKQQEVYGLAYSAAESRIGNQDLNPSKDGLNENGRPKRNTRKRLVNDTDQETGTEATSEELPPKRIRRQRIPTDGIAPSRADTGSQSREGSAAPRTFKSGKRIGRPPGSKTKAKAQPSKLQSMMPLDESPEPEVKQEDAISVPFKINRVFSKFAKRSASVVDDEEDDISPPPKHLRSSQSTSESAVLDLAPAPKRRRIAKATSDVEEVATPPKRRRGRAKKEKSGFQIINEIEALPSKERSESVYASRPTSSSSVATTSTTTSHRMTRTSTREVSRPLMEFEEMYNPSRKRQATVDSTIAVEPASKRRKIKEAAPGAESSRRPRTKPGTIKLEEEDESAPAPRRVRKSAPKKGSAAAKLEAVDETLLNPEELEIHRLKVEKQKQKSKLLSEATRKRWASGDMDKAMENRAATNAKKKAEREAKKLSGEAMNSTPVREKRTRKPARKLIEDGSEESKSAGQSFASEYDHFQALASPQGLSLGKRVRKMRMDLAAGSGDEDEDDAEE